MYYDAVDILREQTNEVGVAVCQMETRLARLAERPMWNVPLYMARKLGRFHARG